jgi:hypothetical protein
LSDVKKRMWDDMFGGLVKRRVSPLAGSSRPGSTLLKDSDLHYIRHGAIPANSLLSGSRLLEEQIRGSWLRSRISLSRVSHKCASLSQVALTNERD